MVCSAFLALLQGGAVHAESCPELRIWFADVDVTSLPLPLDECGGLYLGVTSRQMRQGQVALALSMII